MWLSLSRPCLSLFRLGVNTFPGTATTDLSLDAFNDLRLATLTSPRTTTFFFFLLVYLTDLFPFALFHHTAGPSQPASQPARRHHRHPPAARPPSPGRQQSLRSPTYPSLPVIVSSLQRPASSLPSLPQPSHFLPAIATPPSRSLFNLQSGAARSFFFPQHWLPISPSV